MLRNHDRNQPTFCTHTNSVSRHTHNWGQLRSLQSLSLLMLTMHTCLLLCIHASVPDAQEPSEALACS